MNIRIALAGNPNCGKTTLFNALTGSNQYVGNWPGVTVEKKEGKLKKHEGVTVTDLPGIYSLSPYTLEEVVARKYLVDERPDAILNIVDGTNLERNLYLTTQLIDLGIPVVIAINMMDVVRKRGDVIHIDELSRRLGCPIVEISALKGDGIQEAAEVAVEAARKQEVRPVPHAFAGVVEHALAHIEEAAVHDMPEAQQRWYAVKIFERDPRVLGELNIPADKLAHMEKDIALAERELDDDAESIITNERYLYVTRVLDGCYKRKNVGKLSASDKIDRVVTNRFAALPIFAAIMFLVYYLSVTTVGTWVTDWTNDGVFGEGWHLFGVGGEAYAADAEAVELVEDFVSRAEAAGLDVTPYREAADADQRRVAVDDLLTRFPATETDVDGDGVNDLELWVYEDGETFEAVPVTAAEVASAIKTAHALGFVHPDPSDYGWLWVPGVPVLVEQGLTAANVPDWLNSLLLDGIVAGVGAVLGFVPQILMLFLMLSFLEACGYMARIAFVLDRIFRKFGLSGKSFIPLLVGSGCGVPGIMASRTIENPQDRRMTVITTTFIPCGAKLPIIAMITAVAFGGAEKGWWLAPVCYLVGVVAVVVSGIILKKTKAFMGEPSPFVMELPAYHMPTPVNVLRAMWERGWSFIKKAGTIILISTMVIWLGTVFGTVDGRFGFYLDAEGMTTVLDYIGMAVAWLFVPLGFGQPTAAVATLMGLIAKEEVVAVFGVTGFDGFTRLAALSFLLFNLLCAPCFAAMGAIRREMNSGRWTAFAIIYQCVFAYAVSLMVYNIGSLINGSFAGGLSTVWLVMAFLVLALFLFLLFRRPSKVRRK